MTFQLAVRITGDASGLRTAASEAASSVSALDRVLVSVQGRSTGFSATSEQGAAILRALSGAQDNFASATEAASGKLGAGAAAHKAHGEAANLNRAQMLELGHVAKSTVEQLAAGAPVLTILAQQGASVAQAFSMGSVGVGGVLRAAGGAIAGALTPVVALTGGVAALSAGAIYAGERWRGLQRDVMLGLSGIGRASGATAADINRIASQGAEASGGRLTTGDARGAALAAASTGKIGAANIPGGIRPRRTRRLLATLPSARRGSRIPEPSGRSCRTSPSWRISRTS